MENTFEDCEIIFKDEKLLFHGYKDDVSNAKIQANLILNEAAMSKCIKLNLKIEKFLLCMNKYLLIFQVQEIGFKYPSHWVPSKPEENENYYKLIELSAFSKEYQDIANDLNCKSLQIVKVFFRVFFLNYFSKY